ncbi:hypothetical protein DMB42_16705 [Nonomuraea sp. WAC 01424]|uniref:hypothetical protein n=1 Tax=Nonomuraea sp. WAC 01424 TaxID=2203200 RepID=UPI000F7A6DDC|nr:hypothetical protein [Nonomuraea sp. WAC 01424]RSN10534.1 hypothetical protein DMB42_16705 [Nonomuraea sp. WAC 01424]
MSDKPEEPPEELPETVRGVDGESDVVAERSASGTPRARRPVSADRPEKQQDPDPADTDDEHTAPGTVVRPDAGPTG